ncbi:hypothetical protein FHW79_006317 [Azospirillum sp. OGB3]|nr:hypothetical protein [Azospirillum sp. OGB3]
MVTNENLMVFETVQPLWDHRGPPGQRRSVTAP